MSAPARRAVATALGVLVGIWAFLAVAASVISDDAGWVGTDVYPFSRSELRLERLLAYYDGSYYLEIAAHGYAAVAARQGSVRPYAFFPLFPLAIRAVRAASGGLLPLVAAAAVVVVVAFVAACVLLDGTLRRYVAPDAARRGLLYFVLFPAMVFYVALYPEGTFLALSLGTFALARRRWWWRSGCVAALAALARPQGVLLALPLAVELLRDAGRAHARPRLVDAASLVLPLAALIAYGSFTAAQTGRFAVFFEAQRLWGRSAPALSGLVRALDVTRFADLPLHEYAASQLDLGLTLVFLALLPAIARHQRPSHLAYACALLLLPLGTGTTTSMLRAMSLSFPHFAELGRIGARSRTAHAMICALFLVMLGFVSLRFVAWRWAG